MMTVLPLKIEIKREGGGGEREVEREVGVSLRLLTSTWEEK